MLSGDIETEAGHRPQADPAGDLQIVDLYALVGIAVRAGQDQQIVVRNVLLGIRQFEEGLVDAVQLFRIQLH